MLLGSQRVNAQGHLEIGGCDTLDLAREFGTPLYVMDEGFIRDNCRRYKAAFDARYPKKRHLVCVESLPQHGDLQGDRVGRSEPRCCLGRRALHGSQSGVSP